jgi:hypothetical protein
MMTAATGKPGPGSVAVVIAPPAACRSGLAVGLDPMATAAGVRDGVADGDGDGDGLAEGVTVGAGVGGRVGDADAAAAGGGAVSAAIGWIDT